MGKCFCANDKYVLQLKYLKCSEEEELFAIRTHAASVQHASLEQSNFEFVFHFSCRCGKRRVELAGTNTQKASKPCNIFQMHKSVKKVTDIKCAKSTGLSRRTPAAAWAEISVFICGTNCPVWQMASVAPIVAGSYWKISCNNAASGQYHTFCHPVLLSIRGAAHCHQLFSPFVFFFSFPLSLFSFYTIYFHFSIALDPTQ